MSDIYRDDVNEIGVASDEAWIRLTVIAEDTARGRDQLHFRLKTLTQHSAYVSDEFTDRVNTLLAATAVASEEWHGFARKQNLLSERARGRDALFTQHRTLIVEEGHGADELLNHARIVTVERGHVHDEVFGQRYAQDVVKAHGKGRDGIVSMARSMVDEHGQGAALALGKLRASMLVQAGGFAADEILDATRASVVMLLEQARGDGQAFGQLKAAQLVNDLSAVGWDELIYQSALIGQAWTADADGWAMSRYAPFGFTGLSVIDGKVYATAPDGLYVLDGQDEEMQALVRTGKLDCAKGAMATPTDSRIEYELDGTATLGVTTTQNGKEPRTYTYPLKARPHADELTNARFELGRGLYGRHFAYTLTLTGKRAFINDWTVTVLPSKRSL